MLQRFYASDKDTFTWPNGAIGHRPGGSFDCLGPFAKVTACPIGETGLHLTCYATALPDTFYSIPACTRYRGRYIGGFFMTDGDTGIRFVPFRRFEARFH